jgi:hypothetical protein
VESNESSPKIEHIEKGQAANHDAVGTKTNRQLRRRICSLAEDPEHIMKPTLVVDYSQSGSPPWQSLSGQSQHMKADD